MKRMMIPPMLALAVLLLPGCMDSRSTVQTSFPYYHNPQLAQTQRVVVCPSFHDENIGTSAANAVNEALPAAWRETGLFEVVQLNHTDREKHLPDDVLRLNQVPSENLRAIRVAYRADAVLLTRIEHARSYDPVAIGLRCVLVDCGDGTVLWTASGHFDSSRLDVQNDIKSWHRNTNGNANANIAGWRNVLQSPRLFARYISHRLCSTLPDATVVVEAVRPDRGRKRE